MVVRSAVNGGDVGSNPASRAASGRLTLYARKAYMVRRRFRNAKNSVRFRVRARMEDAAHGEQPASKTGTRSDSIVFRSRRVRFMASNWCGSPADASALTFDSSTLR
jgi:hypothetical protein